MLALLAQQPPPKPVEYECVRWMYEDYVKFKVVCLQWRKRNA
jgi:hypothetical protein